MDWHHVAYPRHNLSDIGRGKESIASGTSKEALDLCPHPNTEPSRERADTESREKRASRGRAKYLFKIPEESNPRYCRWTVAGDPCRNDARSDSGDSFVFVLGRVEVFHPPVEHLEDQGLERLALFGQRVVDANRLLAHYLSVY